MTRIEIPDDWLGKPIKGALKRALEDKPKKGKTKSIVASAPNIVSARAITDPKNWVILTGRTHGTYNYPDLVVCMHRLGMSPDVEQAARTLNLSLQNTATEKDGTQYLGNITWEEALRLNLTLGYQTMNPRQGMDLLADLNAGKLGKKKIYDASGTKIREKRLEVLYDEIRKVRDPWRAEWLDAKFTETSTGLFMLSKHKLDTSGNLTPRYNRPLESCLTENTPFNPNSLNSQGLPTKSQDRSTFYFYNPSNGTVAWFYAVSGWAFLFCVRGPSGRGAGLGVRAVREKN